MPPKPTTTRQKPWTRALQASKIRSIRSFQQILEFLPFLDASEIADREWNRRAWASEGYPAYSESGRDVLFDELQAECREKDQKITLCTMSGLGPLAAFPSTSKPGRAFKGYEDNLRAAAE
jgi:hypothetical protein